MKRILAISLVLITVVLLFCSCGQKDPSYDVTDVVLLENDDCKLTFKDITSGFFGGKNVNFTFENKSSKKLTVAVEQIIVYGYETGAFTSTEAEPGQTINHAALLFDSDLEKIGVETADEMIVNFMVSDGYDEDLGDLAVLYSGTKAIYPTGKSKSDIVYPERKVVAGERVLVDNDQVTFVVQGIDKGVFGWGLKVFAQNKLDGIEAEFYLEDLVVDGIECEYGSVTDVKAGIRKYDDLSLYGTDEMDSIKTVSFKLSVYDSSDWESDDYIFDPQEFTLTF